MQSQAALQLARLELARATQASRMGAMTASIAHEINQPLAAIRTNANAGLRWITKTPPDVYETRNNLERIVHDTQRATDVVHNVRAIFKSDETFRSAIDLNRLIKEVLTLTQDDLQSRAIVVRTELDEKLTAVLANRLQLQQVLLNLITNAVEAMDSVTDRRRLLLIKSEVGKDGAVDIAVEDTGTGINPEDDERIFSSFFTTKDTGMGMGLSICRSIIESHGGRLSASSGHPYGAVFRFTLPGSSHTA